LKTSRNQNRFLKVPYPGSLATLFFSLLLTLSVCHALDLKDELFSTAGYRIDQFRAPVPETVPGAQTIDTTALQSLMRREETLLIDVLPTPVKPKDRPDNLLWLPPARQNIPGSYWLPNVGFGQLSQELEDYFHSSLERLSKGDKAQALVIYCLADCWMSWNAAKRAALEYGYSQVYWYPDGTTAWEAEGLELEKCLPEPMPDDQSR
jgi:PQQ-dependent catabolism-associated CXXCW motif protein